MIKDSQYKKLDKVFSRAQLENSDEKKEKLIELEELTKGTPEYEKKSKEIGQIRTISDGTKQTYKDVLKSVIRESERKFGVTEWKNLKPEHTESILNDKIARGESPNNIRKVVHALEFFQVHTVKTRVFKEKHIDVCDYQKNLDTIREKGVIRRSADSHRYKATKEESLLVIEEMEKYNPKLAAVARYQLLTGFRISEAIRQKLEYVDLVNDKHHAIGAKGGLNNVVSTNHHTQKDKEFLSELMKKPESGTDRIFHREKDKNGNYKSDEQIRLSMTRLANRCAKRLGIGGDGLTFSSHSFRGAFALDRMEYYAGNYKNLDKIIEDKIKEQPRLREKYDNFEKRIRDKVKPELRAERKIKDFEKIQWLVSTDLNHSRQDIVRYYIPSSRIKNELKNTSKVFLL